MAKLILTFLALAVVSTFAQNAPMSPAPPCPPIPPRGLPPGQTCEFKEGYHCGGDQDCNGGRCCPSGCFSTCIGGSRAPPRPPREQPAPCPPIAPRPLPPGQTCEFKPGYHCGGDQDCNGGRCCPSGCYSTCFGGSKPLPDASTRMCPPIAPRPLPPGKTCQFDENVHCRGDQDCAASKGEICCPSGCFSECTAT